ncbi:outer membrane transport energization protein ExbB [Limimonas halophila]|uniref:Outer membrane transport energization protein ExbB n=1 Tax=Limimonas halophila TaxID=1082479 RepID=A0A1G7L0G6_9PROT|nr:MotA/TolQ/ExbB proton channel family protein [Limimonas halophila]SDF42600.1 outer membrane transport energization protein ExbB [Limimonas halophila]
MQTDSQGILDTLLSLAQAGGPVVVILVALSVIALAVTLAKAYQLWRARPDPDGTVEAALNDHRRGATAHALNRLNAGRGALAPILARALAGLRGGAGDRASLREEIEREAGQLMEELRSHLRVLEIIAAVSPLLGLLGTVLGMIEAFQQMEAAGSRVDPAVLSGGIWEALLTTAVGLAVAIPTLMAFTWLERQVERITHHAEDAITRVFTAEASAHAVPEPAPAVQAAE